MAEFRWTKPAFCPQYTAATLWSVSKENQGLFVYCSTEYGMTNSSCILDKKLVATQDCIAIHDVQKTLKYFSSEFSDTADGSKCHSDVTTAT